MLVLSPERFESLRAVWLSGAAPLLICRGQFRVRCLDPTAGLPQARASWISPRLCVSLFLKLPSFLADSVAVHHCTPCWPGASRVFRKDVSHLLWREGCLPSTVCALSHRLFHFPSHELQSLLVCFEDWVRSPWTIEHNYLRL